MYRQLLESVSKDIEEEVNNLHPRRLPISGVNVEKAPFDMQKLKNPEIEGEEYQNRELKGHTSVR